jgi:hypothetical protein
VLDRVREERLLRGAHDRDRPEARLPLRPAQEHGREPLADVAAPRQLRLAPAGARRDDERHAGGAVGGELGEQLRELVRRERALPRLVPGRERDRDDLLHAPAPHAGADGEPEGLAEDNQLLRDGRVRRALGTPARDVPVHVGRPEPRERERDGLAARVRLEDANQVARLAFVEVGGVAAPPAGGDLLLVEL